MSGNAYLDHKKPLKPENPIPYRWAEARIGIADVFRGEDVWLTNRIWMRRLRIRLPRRARVMN
ncbi:hypothetical protein DND58_10755 [Pseudomonas syringae pv. pisi]|nr:hypothetical protein DND62_07855 [Pseudomonas syringae pv. pisi]PYD31632.1 hypothetical protein DND58_10755 [Pseudomonas syringae pv. pisi]PYD36202.1 hypothetical protein DND67_01760 [Pseudomonas syringae pv. pisi]